jgi:hypothetical protein
MNNLESIVSDIYGDVDVFNGNSNKQKELKKVESEIFSKYTMNYSKKFSTWW